VRPGDLFGSGTASGPDARRQGGSLMELTWGGTRPLGLPGGEERGFLCDGATIVLRGWCGSADDGPGIELGEVAGTLSPA
jgi:fumarylacetoacetase